MKLPWYTKASLALVLVMSVALCVLLLPTLFGVGILRNNSSSMPIGFWLIHYPSHPYRPGDIVIACPPLDEEAARYFGTGFCPSEHQPLVKTVAAAAGDTVVTTEDYIMVNGFPMESSDPREEDGKQRPLHHYPFGTYVVPAGEVWLLAPHDWSYDSRYLGPIKVSDIRGDATPLWVSAE